MTAAGDVRVMRSEPLRGGARFARHLWRMCFALFIAAGSFFSIQARVAEAPSGPVHDRRDARSSSRVGLGRDALLAVAGPWPAAGRDGAIAVHRRLIIRGTGEGWY